MSSNIQLRDYQQVAVTEVREAFRGKLSPVLFVLPTGGGKCLGRDTPVLMFDGTIKPVQDVVVGDLLMGPDSKPRRVLSLAHGREHLYRVTPVKGDAYVVNESHILSLRNKRGVVKNIPVREYLDEPWHWRIRNPGWRVPGILHGDLEPELTQITVEPIGEGDYYGFEIDGDHLFMLGDFTVTHNTYTFSYIASSAADKGRRVCIIVHRKELLLQASGSLRALGIEHGLISPHFTPNPHARVQVASVDTLLIRLKRQAFDFDLLIFDEAHHVIDGNKWGRAYELLGKPHMLGVTATPVRTDGKGLGEHAGGLFKTMVLGPSVAELIDRGMLINPIVYTSLEVPDLSGIHTNKDGEYNSKELAARVDRPKITGSAVAEYTKICPGARAIVFCASVDHAKHVVAEFNAAGYRFDLLVGEPEMSDAQRTDVNKRLRSGELQGACTVDLVSEGYDLCDLQVCIMLRPTASEALFLQQVGRVMRPSDGKTKCWLLDQVGNVGVLVDGGFKRKHGLPNEVRDWSLDGRKKKKKGQKEQEVPTIDLKQCASCFVVSDPKSPHRDDCEKCADGEPVHTHCGSCGAPWPVSSRALAQVEGELHQVTEEVQAQLRQQQRSAQAAAKSVEDMMRELGYSRTRAEAIVKARAEKAELRTSLITDLQEWRRKTGQGVETFGLEYLSDLKQYKPKALKELRERFDAHCQAYTAGRIQHLRGDLFQPPSGQEAAF